MTDRYGVRIKNPLSLPVRVELLDGRGVVGQAVVEPHTTVYIPVSAPDDYQIRTTIIRMDGAGSQEEVGDATWRPIEHQDILPLARPIRRQGDYEGSSQNWQALATWIVSKGCVGTLEEITVSHTRRSRTGDAVPEYRLSIQRPAGRSVSHTFKGPGSHTRRDLTKLVDELEPGESVVLEVRSTGGRISVEGEIVGEELTQSFIGDKLRIKEKKPKTDDVPIRTLGDIFDEIKKREEVKS